MGHYAHFNRSGCLLRWLLTGTLDTGWRRFLGTMRRPERLLAWRDRGVDSTWGDQDGALWRAVQPRCGSALSALAHF